MPEKFTSINPNKLASFILLSALLSINVVPAAEETLDNPLESLAHVSNHFVPMRDDVRMWTSVYRPVNQTGKVPAVLVRTPYRFIDEMRGGGLTMQRHLLEQGYALVFQHERGHFWSEGEYKINGGAGDDGYDTVDWIVKQPWSNGKAGTFGCSSSGDNQIRLSAREHPAHAAAIIASAGTGVGPIGPFHDPGLFTRGGVPQVPWAVWYATAGQRNFPKFPEGISAEQRDWLAKKYNIWAQPFFAAEDLMYTLPVMDMVKNTGIDTGWEDFIRRSPSDPRWQEEALYQEGEPFRAAALWFAQIHDIGLHKQVATFEHILSRAGDIAVNEHQKLVVSALEHCSMLKETENTIDGERHIGDARFDYLKLMTDWYDYWLKGKKNDVLETPAVQAYMPGLNEWLQYEQWPPANRTYKTFYLGSQGKANGRQGDGVLSPVPQSTPASSSFDYNPDKPVISVGGDICCAGPTYLPGSFDYSKLEDREDVLVFTSEPLKEAVEVLGYPEVEIYLSSDAPDTDLTVKLFDVYPDGSAYILTDSIQRVRWREGYDKPVFMEKGKVYKVIIDPMFVSNHFLPGHSIRLEISSSNFPRYLRNMNTGGNNYDETEGRIARNSVHFSTDYPTRIVLPVNIK